MSYTVFGHPFSSYTWKALIALYEKELPFDYVVVEDEESAAELRKHWPIGKFPLLVHEDVPVFESTTIIEYLDLRHY
jgi:glutathione S-transferase